ncbi:TrkH family potassium uptake protein [Paracoccaceae bacterium GXU_MW_L88]
MDIARARGSTLSWLIRPVAYLIGVLLTALGALMLIPMLFDIVEREGHWDTFAESGLITMGVGLATALATRDVKSKSLNIQQIFLITVGLWLVLPFFGALPFLLGAPHASFTDAIFESVSGMTTTGSTVFTGLDELPRGTQLWRSMLQWTGGLGIVVVAVAFLPSMGVGGMQFFRSEGFDTFGKVLPSASGIAGGLFQVYLWLTLFCILAYHAVGMSSFDAIIHALTTISTGGFSNYDASFGAFQGPPEYVASVFMILASLPFVLYVRMAKGEAVPFWKDVQVRGFMVVLASIIVALTLYRVLHLDDGLEHSFREAIFNATSIMSGTGYASTDYWLWGSFAATVMFVAGLIGGCAGSTCCSIKIFRFQILLQAVRAQIRQIHSPHGVFVPRYDGVRIDEQLVASVMAFFMLFLLTLGVTAVILALMGLDTVTAISGATTAVANIGPGLGPTIGPAGNFSTLGDAPKWVLIIAMLMGRLEILSVLVLFMPRFWRG